MPQKKKREEEKEGEGAEEGGKDGNWGWDLEY